TPPLCGVWCLVGLVVSLCYGGHSVEETPGSIPNPEAKLDRADGTALGRVWESRSPPDIFTGSGGMLEPPFYGRVRFLHSLFFRARTRPGRGVHRRTEVRTRRTVVEEWCCRRSAVGQPAVGARGGPSLGASGRPHVPQRPGGQSWPNRTGRRLREPTSRDTYGTKMYKMYNWLRKHPRLVDMTTEPGTLFSVPRR